MSVVATMSNMAGIKNNKGLNCWLPLTIGLSSMGYYKNINLLIDNITT